MENLEEIMGAVLPMGFNVGSKMVVHNVAHALRKMLETERLYLFENSQNSILFN